MTELEGINNTSNVEIEILARGDLLGYRTKTLGISVSEKLANPLAGFSKNLCIHHLKSDILF